MPMSGAVQVTGVQPVGSRGLNTVQAVVTDEKPPSSFTAPTTTGRDAPKTTPQHTVTQEPVVFLREGPRTDQRPPNLKQQKAAARYRESEQLASHSHHARRPRR